MKRSNREREVSLISGEIAVINVNRQLVINGEVQELSPEFTTNYLDRFFNELLPYLYSYEVSRALRIFPFTNKDNFWVKFVIKAG
jgi:hypothetical protein